MTVNSEKLAKISRQIKALMSKTVESGASEAEALSAAEKVQELMNLYDLSMDDIEVKTQEFIAEDIVTGKSTATAVHNMINAIGVFTDTKPWFKRSWDKSKGIVYTFFGSKKDVQFAHFLFDLFVKSIDFELKKHQKTADYKSDPTNGKTKSNSFKIGMTTRLNQRLQEIKRAREVANQEMGLVLYNKMALTNEKFNEVFNNMKIKTEKRKQTLGSYDSYFAGKKAGDNVTITTGLAGTTGGMKRLSGK